MSGGARVYSVAQINSYIKNMFAQDYLLTSVRVQGEVSNCKYHQSGHVYFTLKDSAAAISCVLFAGNRRKLTFRLADGQKVVAAGSVGVYEKGGSYQLYVSEVQAAGLGELYERYEALKKELLEMGMFDEGYKQPIPAHVRTLGVVTAPTGAAVRDIIQIAKRRDPGIRILLYPAKVQGEGAAESIIRGIEMLDRPEVDCIIIGRGGGSIEDLWAFNEEEVARAVFSCMTPVISAVGHETDTVITDFVADLRAPTPSAAAELAVADVSRTLALQAACRERMLALMQTRLREERARLARYRLPALMSGRLEQEKSRAEQYRLRLALLGPMNMICQQRVRLMEAENALRERMERRLEQEKSRAALQRQRLEGLSPYRALSAGYAYVTGEDGRRLTSVDAVTAGERLQIYLHDGQVLARAEEMKKKE